MTSEHVSDTGQELLHWAAFAIFERAFAENRSPAEIANDIAESILYDQHREASSAQSR